LGGDISVNMNIAKIGLATASKLAVVAAMVMIFMIGNVNAYWRLECDGSVGLARLDPLMNFGTAGDHVHSIKGGSGKFLTSFASNSWFVSIVYVALS
jgi:hypothetical protein